MSIRPRLLLFALTFAAGAQQITAQQITMDLDPAKSKTDRYPDISFAPTKVVGTVSPTGNSPVKVTGWFSLHGQRHEITIPMEVHMSGSDILATSSFSIPYVAWGLKNPSTFMLRVNDHVDVQLTAAGSLAAVRMSRR
jgi:polyisoprenoid-binding protein YceI